MNKLTRKLGFGIVVKDFFKNESIMKKITEPVYCLSKLRFLQVQYGKFILEYITKNKLRQVKANQRNKHWQYSFV